MKFNNITDWIKVFISILIFVISFIGLGIFIYSWWLIIDYHFLN